MAHLRVENLTKTFHVGGESVRAVRGVSFTIERGKTLALIGESGSGKSTVGRLVLRLVDADAGRVHLGDVDVLSLPPRRVRAQRREMQIVFQEPFESLNPRMRVADIVAEPLVIHERGLTKDQRRQRVRDVLDEVGLVDYGDRYPQGLSGGQQQRIGIARALITNPSFVVLDEPTSSLDLSVQAQVLDVLSQVQERHGLAYLYISHDLATVREIADDVAVMYRGEFREVGPVAAITSDPRDPYTRLLMSGFLSVDPREAPAPLQSAPARPGVDLNEPGCVFRARCVHVAEECSGTDLSLSPVGDTKTLRQVRCVRHDELAPAPGDVLRRGADPTSPSPDREER
ncbi:ATP-binding cassette domain-containing protein [Actinomadura sp. 9N215]|uniref:ATP-binding cassette domain-containing protein n=1 Tax=Actinomadura sp. 9N215 TaxID=3375150 RepID=UPI00379928D2